jgi:amino-acid N-acetyltransferase
MKDFSISPAELEHVDRIVNLIKYWADLGELLERSRVEVLDAIRDFKIALDLEGNLVGCSSLHVLGKDVAEVRSLAVDPNVQTKGIGAALVAACVEDAHTYKVDRVFALTYQQSFFEKQGFELANVMDFPEKVWNECVRCPFFSNCREIAVVRELHND